MAAVVALVAVALAIVLPSPQDRSVPFVSAGTAGDGATLWAIGDGADGGDAAKDVARLAAEDRPDRVLYLGDVYEEGTAETFRRYFGPTYRSVLSRMAPTPGNHDWPTRARGYNAFWEAYTGSPTPPWYRFEIAGWEVVSLNSEAPHGPGSEQVRWLRDLLDDAPGTCRLAFYHRPRYNAGFHGDQKDVAPLWDALRGHAAVVVNGHDHNLQRFKPIDGMLELISGAGGHGHYETGDPDPRTAFVDDDDDGALRIRLKPGSAELAFVRADGETVDRSSARCAPLRRA
jgi:acid phosphatase type 7